MQQGLQRAGKQTGKPLADIEEQPREGKQFAFRQNAHDPYIDCLSAIDLLIEPSLQRHERAMDDGPVHVRSFEVPAKDIGVSEPSPRLIADDDIQCLGLIGVTACCEVHECARGDTPTTFSTY